MEPIETKSTNLVLKAPEGQEKDVKDLPVARFQWCNYPAIESCWKLSPEELEEVKKTGVIYFDCIGMTHPPICISATSIAEGDTGYEK